jgi:hypothetical protein
MLAKFKKIQFGLSNSYQDNNIMKKQILSICQGIKDYSFILWSGVNFISYKNTITRLRSIIDIKQKTREIIR